MIFAWPVVKCYGLNVCISPNSYVEILTLSVMVLGSEAFEGCLILERRPHKLN